MPCDVLFLGEAPGDDDDRSGVPLSGRNGMILDRLVSDVAARAYDDDKESPKLPISYCVALSIGCVPWSCGDSPQYRRPSPAEEKACLPRLASLLELIEPKSIMLLGDAVKQYWQRNEKYLREFVSYLPDSRTIARIPTPTEIIAKGGTSVGNDTYREARSVVRQIVLNRVLKPR
jgi:uracil-DNA glycosylase